MPEGDIKKAHEQMTERFQAWILLSLSLHTSMHFFISEGNHVSRLASTNAIARTALYSTALVLGAIVPVTALGQTSTPIAPNARQSTSNFQTVIEKPREKTKVQPEKNAKGTTKTAAQKAPGSDVAYSPKEMFEKGKVDGDIRVLDYTSHNGFFTGENQNTASYGGRLGFTSASLDGFSFGLAFYAQRAIDHSHNSFELAASTLAPNISALGEAYIQYQTKNLRVRLGNQRLDVPFTSTTDWRIIPPLFQGATLRYGDQDNYISFMRIFRFKSYISDSFDKKTTYNADYVPYPPNTTQDTNGFWALGGGRKMPAGPVDLKGQAWFLDYLDYGRMFYVDGQVAASQGEIKPFMGLQFVRETDAGRALVGRIDNHTYGAQLGIKHNSLSATLNYDYIPHEAGTFLNGSLVTPYEHNVSAGPLFAQPFLTSTQDLGSGKAYAVDVKGAAVKNTFLGARYSYMDLKPATGASTIGQSEYLVYGIYNFSGALKGLSFTDFFGYQTQKIQTHDFWQNRAGLEYDF